MWESNHNNSPIETRKVTSSLCLCGSRSNEHTWFDWRIYHLAINTTMPRQSRNSVRGQAGFSKSRGLRVGVSFPPFPSHFSHFFSLVPIFVPSKSEKCFKPAESPMETLATQASVQWVLPQMAKDFKGFPNEDKLTLLILNKAKPLCIFFTEKCSCEKLAKMNKLTNLCLWTLGAKGLLITWWIHVL